MAEEFMARAELMPKGRLYEDFEVGQVFHHHWGRTINEGDNSLFSTLTLNFNPLYFNREFALAHGHPDVQVNPLLVFNTVFGLTVEDLSEMGGPFVGVDDLTYHLPVYPGDTLVSRSRTMDKRVSASRPGVGLVTWHTEGFNQRDERVIDYRRTNIVRLRSANVSL
jgi:itaconyl-CoA hydratase